MAAARAGQSDGQDHLEYARPRGVPRAKRHPKASPRDSPQATDGSRFVAIFGSKGLSLGPASPQLARCIVVPDFDLVTLKAEHERCALFAALDPKRVMGREDATAHDAKGVPLAQEEGSQLASAFRSLLPNTE